VKALTIDETKDLISKNGIDIIQKKASSKYRKVITKNIPKDSGVRNYYASVIAELPYNGEIVLYIDEYNIWPTSQNMDLFNGYRRSIGIEKPINEIPTHLLSVNEKRELHCLLDMVLYFSWGAWLFTDTDASEILRFSHDEMIDVFSIFNPIKETELIKGIRGLGQTRS
jgi:hypothetical protein